MSKYSKEFKEEAIRLPDEIGNKKAAAQPGLPYYTLADKLFYKAIYAIYMEDELEKYKALTGGE
ncbi:MAG: hypothetical protein SOW78_07910 [Clostridia bacterium]|nr:hypothetical protein [Clostridia bacterium]